MARKDRKNTQGDTGAQGAQGAQGVQGVPGVPGVQGDTGARGTAGESGSGETAGKLSKLTDVIESLTDISLKDSLLVSGAIDRLCERIDRFMAFAANTIPIKVMYIVFLLVFVLIVGIEGVQFLFKTWFPMLLGK